MNMNNKNTRDQILSLWKEIKSSDLLEGLMDIAEELIAKNPDCTDVLIALFQTESNLDRKELLAQMILYGVPHQAAMAFLKNERGWKDFTGFSVIQDDRR
jgi:hypothetical protein